MEYPWQTIEGNSPSKSNEEWRVIPDVPNHIINRKGEILRIKRQIKNQFLEEPIVVNSYHKVSRGSKENRVTLMANGKKVRFGIDKLVDSLFGESRVEDLPNEEWVPIKGMETLYMVSNMGRVKTIAQARSNGYKKERCIKTTNINSGYVTINLHDTNGKLRHCLLHRLVAEHFVPNPENKSQVNHIDENKKNNIASNLQWMTRKENVNYGSGKYRKWETRRANIKMKNNGI